MGCLEGINRRGAWAKPLTSLPTAHTACTTEKPQIPVKMTLCFRIGDHEPIFSGPENFQNHEKLFFDVFEYVVGTLFPDGFRHPGRALELSKRWISPSWPLRKPLVSGRVDVARSQAIMSADEAIFGSRNFSKS